MPDSYLDIAKKAALEAGAMIRAEKDRRHQVDRKSGFDFVTEVDKKSEEIIRNIILTAFPDHGFFGEEQVSQSGMPEDELLKKAGEYTWVVDALDGTTNFIRGIPQYAVSIALLHGQKLAAGAVYDPNRDELFSAAAGQGAYLNGKRIRVSDKTDFADAIVSFGFPAVDMEKRERTMKRFCAVAPLVGSARIYNCAALLLCYAACGRTELTFEEGIHLWDMAAGILLVREAGGEVRKLDGEELDIFARENLAGPRELVRKFTELTAGM